ncbi:MAG: 50S ribosomal protein L24 [Flavobacteriaceae bacterium]|jgi:large subunit ribosomal protein L24|nr:50S ribosomal protein L24 [Flavobacteriaceae bacterium]
MKKSKLKTGDTVRVIAGDHKGSEGKIMKLFFEKDKAIVEGVNLVKRHTKPNAQNPQGGIVEKEAAIHISNLSLITADGDTTRIGYQMNGDNKERISRKTKEVI